MFVMTLITQCIVVKVFSALCISFRLFIQFLSSSESVLHIQVIFFIHVSHNSA